MLRYTHLLETLLVVLLAAFTATAAPVADTGDTSLAARQGTAGGPGIQDPFIYLTWPSNGPLSAPTFINGPGGNFM